MPAPGNDNFANATLIDVSVPGLLSSETNVSATVETGEATTILSFACGQSVWYTFVAPFTGKIVYGIVSPTFDCLTSINTGSAVNALTVVDSYEANGGTQGKAISVTSGTQYYIRVTGYQTQTGTFGLSWVPHDELAHARTISSTSGSETCSPYGATFDSGEPQPSGYAGGTVWYRIKTGGTGGTAQFDTIGANALDGSDSVIGVYTSSSPSSPTYASLTLVAADDQSGGNNDAKVTFTASTNTDYFIQVMPQYNGSPVNKRSKVNWSVPSVSTPANTATASLTLSASASAGMPASGTATLSLSAAGAVAATHALATSWSIEFDFLTPDPFRGLGTWGRDVSQQFRIAFVFGVDLTTGVKAVDPPTGYTTTTVAVQRVSPVFPAPTLDSLGRPT